MCACCDRQAVLCSASYAWILQKRGRAAGTLPVSVVCSHMPRSCAACWSSQSSCEAAASPLPSIGQCPVLGCPGIRNHMPWIALCEYNVPDCGQMPVAGRRKHPTMFALHMSRLQRALALALLFFSLPACSWSRKAMLSASTGCFGAGEGHAAASHFWRPPVKHEKSKTQRGTQFA
jgi:hypothetical protein